MTTPSAPPLAIIGMGCLFPKSGHLGAYWSLLKNGTDAITDVPPTHWNPADYFHSDPKAPDMTYARRGGFLDPYPFPPHDYGIAPNDLEATDTSQLLGLVAAEMALRDAGYGPERSFDRTRVSVILGVTGTLELVIPLGARLGHPHWRRAMKAAGIADSVVEEVVRQIGSAYVGWQENSFPGLLGNVVAGRIANRLDLKGTNCVVDAACASSLSAIHLAGLELASGRCDVVVTGGVDTFNDIFMYMCFSKTPALSPTGDSRPFSNHADGTILGEGLGILVLKRWDDARRDGDRIYAVIRGLGSSSDGKGHAIYAPSAEGQKRCLESAYRQAGISPATVELVEAHGTGTKVGDATELRALTEVYRAARPEGTWCALGSVKSQIGHTKAAAGAAGIIKAALALYHKVLPPTIKVDEPAQPLADDSTPFYLNTQKRPWLPRPDHPRRAAVSAFGFGGSNFHCVLEEAQPDKPQSDWDGSVQIIALDGDSPETILAALSKWKDLDSWDQLTIRAAESRQRFDASAPCRLTIVVTRDGEPVPRMIESALAWLQRESSSNFAASPAGCFWGRGPTPGRLAWLFPGQGSQYVGMLRDWACQFPDMLDALAAADSRGASERWTAAGDRLSDLIFPPPTFSQAKRQQQESALRDTRIAQPALAAVSLGALRVLRSFGVVGEMAAGHSFGELTALYSAGCFGDTEFLDLARMRGRIMAECQREADGGMLAIHATAGDVDRWLGGLQLPLTIANFNSPRQVVVSGPATAIETFQRDLERRGTRATRLPVSAAFHSPQVADAEPRFREALDTVPIRAPRLPVYSNTTAVPYPHDAAAIRGLLAGQLARPVRFTDLIQRMVRDGAATFVEVGPGNVLTRLVEQIVRESPSGRSVDCLAVDASAGRRSCSADLALALARLAARGHAVRLAQWEAEPPHPVVLKPSSSKFTVPICGANYRKDQANKPSVQASASTSASAPTPAPAPTPTFAPTPASAPTPAPTPALDSGLPPTPGSERLPGPTNKKAQPEGRFARTEARVEASFNEVVKAGPPVIDVPRHHGPPPATKQKSEHTVFVPKERTATVSQDSRPPAPATNSALGQALRLTQEGLQVFQQLQEQTAQLHRQFLQHQEMAQQALSRLIEHQQQLILASLNGSAVSVPVSPMMPPVSPTVMPVSPMMPPAPPTRPNVLPTERSFEAIAAVPPAPAPAWSSTAVPSPAPIPEPPPPLPVPPPLPTPAAGVAATPPVSPPRSASRPGASNREKVQRVLLEVVAEKTGYPVEMLDIHMGLDADLGIDSIKRVEILSALQERLPETPAVKPEHLGTLNTLEQIIDFLAGASAASSEEAEATIRPDSARPFPPQSGPQSPPQSSPLSPAVSPAPPGQPQSLGIDRSTVQQTLLEIVSEKTGYPVEMLNPSMGLDADLGIDSIKRVEILSALQERIPDAPMIKPEHLGTLNTLEQIIDFLADSANTSRSEATAEPASIHGSVVRQTLRSNPVPFDSGRSARNVPTAGAIVVVGGADALADHITEEVRSQLGRVTRRFWDSPAQSDEPMAGVILVAPPLASLETLRAAFRWLREFRRRCVDAAVGFVISVSRMDGRFGLSGPWRDPYPLDAGLSGLVKTAHHEWPGISCCAVDVQPTLPPAESARKIVSLAGLTPPLELGLTTEGWNSPTLIETSITPIDPNLFRGDDVIVVTGGARGVTAAVALELARRYAPKLVLLGRTPWPADEPDWLRGLHDEREIKKRLAQRHPDWNLRQVGKSCQEILAAREIRDNLGRIRDSGSAVTYHSVDVRDHAALDATLRQVRQDLGSITAWIHGAGVIEDRLIVDKSDEQFDRVVETKVQGLLHLLECTERDPLRAIALFSSSTARFGRKGQCDYAAANEVLNKMGRWLASRRPDCRVASINWGPWEGGMVTPELRRVFESEGVGLIPLKSGAEFLLAEWSRSDREVESIVLAPHATSEPQATAERAIADKAIAERATASPQVADHPAPMHPVWERAVCVESHPILESHVLDGRAVLPFALHLEWLGHAAMHGQPGIAFVGWDDAQILLGAKVEAEGSLDLFALAGRPEKTEGNLHIRAELHSRGRNGRESIHSRATVILGQRPTPAESARPALLLHPPGPAALRPYERLFHGEQLHAIERITGISDQGIEAVVRCAPPPSSWFAEPLRTNWLADPLAIDAAFQLVVFWSMERRGIPVLPTRFRRYRQFAPSFPPTSVRVLVEVLSASDLKLRVHIEWFAESGAVVARLDDGEFVGDAGMASAFRRNRLIRSAPVMIS